MEPLYASLDAAERLMSVDVDESLDNMSPIFGVDTAPDLSLKECVDRAKVVDNKMVHLFYCGFPFAPYLLHTSCAYELVGQLLI